MALELEDLPRLLFINKECGNLKVGVDDGKFTRNANKKEKEKSDVLQAYRSDHSVEMV